MKGQRRLYERSPSVSALIRGRPIWSYCIEVDVYIWMTKPRRTFMDPSATRDEAAAAIKAARRKQLEFQ